MSQSPTARGFDRDRSPYACDQHNQRDLRYSYGTRYSASNMDSPHPDERQARRGSLNPQSDTAGDGDPRSRNANGYGSSTFITQADLAANRVANGGRNVVTRGHLDFIGSEAEYELGDTKEDNEELRFQMSETNRVQPRPIDALNDVDGLTITSSLRVVGRSIVFKSKDHELQRQLAQQKLDHEYRMAQLQVQANLLGAAPPGYSKDGAPLKPGFFGNEFSG